MRLITTLSSNVTETFLILRAQRSHTQLARALFSHINIQYTYIRLFYFFFVGEGLTKGFLIVIPLMLTDLQDIFQLFYLNAQHGLEIERGKEEGVRRL